MFHRWAQSMSLIGPVGALWMLPSMGVSLGSSPMMRSWAPRACSARLLNSPAVIHSSRRDRRVVSDTMLPVSRSTVTHEAPVTRRIRIPRKHVRSSIRGLWQPSGWFLVGEGGTLPLLPRLHLPLRGQAARDDGDPPSCRCVLVAPDIKIGTTQRPVDDHLPARPLSEAAGPNGRLLWRPGVSPQPKLR